MEISVELMISLGINLVLFLIIICLIVYVLKIKNRLNKFLPENKNMDIEEMLYKYVEIVKEVLEKEDKILEEINLNKNEAINNLNNVKAELQNNIDITNNRINEIKDQLKLAIQKIGFVRYNPFEEVGGELCYAIAFLNENNNGIVINSIYSRENCYSYAKDITNGESLNHKLSQEEIQAVQLAMQKNKGY